MLAPAGGVAFAVKATTPSKGAPIVRVTVIGVASTTIVVWTGPARAVTVVRLLVVSVVRASPLPSVVTVRGDSWPVSAEKATVAPLSGLPDASSTVATIVARPFDTVSTLSRMFEPWPAPMITSTASAAAPPDTAPIRAVPAVPPAVNVAVARPFVVRASRGSMVPSVDVNVTTVPFWGGVPLLSWTIAVTPAVPLSGSAVVFTVSVTDEPVGAVSGIRSQERQPSASSSAVEAKRKDRDTVEADKDNRRMKLAGQGNGAPASRGERGYAMAALLVGMSVMAVLMTAALPSWTHMIQREKEEEYLFRAKQYARAIQEYNRKMGSANSPAPSVDFLVEQRFLRKKYKDPLTGEDFELVRMPTVQPGFGGGQRMNDPRSERERSMVANREAPQGKGGDGGPFVGVRSKSKEAAIKLFKGQQTTYDQWEITMMDVSLTGGPPNPANPGQTNGNPFQSGTNNPFRPGMNNGSGFRPAGPGGFPQPSSPFNPGGGNVGQPMMPSQGPFQPPQGSPVQMPGGNPQVVPKFPPLPNGPFKPMAPTPAPRPPQ